MAKKVFNIISWEYALGEVFFIFIGITMAIWFRSWIEDRQAQNIELNSLKELKEAIETDLADIKDNIWGYNNRVQAYETAVRYLEEDLPENDTIISAFSKLLSITYFISNIGPYETLKSRGMGIISNDSLRSRLAYYYDTEYESVLISEKFHHEMYSKYRQPQAIAKFDLDGYSLRPVDYQALLDDFELEQVFKHALLRNQGMLNIYEDIKVSAEYLIRDIEDEIKRLER